MEGLETPVGPYTGWVLGERVGLAPILRAGMQMTERESIGRPLVPYCPRSGPIIYQ
jgi:uracil phosphoribosyltransferase